MMTPERAQHIETLRKINAFALTVPERAAVDYAIAALLTEAPEITRLKVLVGKLGLQLDASHAALLTEATGPEKGRPMYHATHVVEGRLNCLNCGIEAWHPSIGLPCPNARMESSQAGLPGPSMKTSATVAEAREALIIVTDPARGVSAQRVLMQIDALIAAARADAQTTQEGKA